MKKLFLTPIIAFIFSISAIAQIPNFSFENWTNVGSYSIPDTWGTMNNTTASFSVYTATKGTPGNPGNSYLKLTSLTTGTTVTNGIAVSGKLDTINKRPITGFACTLQPVSFTGKWQHMIYGSSQGSLKAVLTKWNTGTNKRDTVAIASQILSGMAMSWANFTINFNYLSNIVPDSSIIELKASGSNPTNNDYLWVDNLGYTGSVTGLKEKSINFNSLILYPVPTRDILNIQIDLTTEQQIKYTISDLNGKLIKSGDLGIQSGAVNKSISLTDISNGNYILQLHMKNETVTKKITKE